MLADENGAPELVEYDPRAPRREVNAPYVKSDESIEGIRSMTGSNKVYYSKSALRAEYKRMGFEEIGNDVAHLTAPRGRVVPANYDAKMQEDVAKSIEQVRYNQAPLSEFDKARCKIINESISNSELSIGGTEIRADARKI